MKPIAKTVLVVSRHIISYSAIMHIDNATTTLKEISDHFYEYSKARGWEKGYDPSFLSKSIIIESAELLEHFQKHDGESALLKMQDANAKKEVTWEMVDILYYLLMLAKILDVDMVVASREKLEELATRYPADNEKRSK